MTSFEHSQSIQFLGDVFALATSAGAFDLLHCVWPVGVSINWGTPIAGWFIRENPSING